MRYETMAEKAAQGQYLKIGKKKIYRCLMILIEALKRVCACVCRQHVIAAERS